MQIGFVKVFGVARNDVYGYSDTKEYRTWTDMLKRCYGKNQHHSYTDCFVCEEWLLFSNFLDWMDRQNWKDCDLDKDILEYGNKEYSPDKCAFIPHKLNQLLTNKKRRKGVTLPPGVMKYNNTGRFRARLTHDSKTVYLGVYDTPEEAFENYKAAKSQIIKEAAMQQEPRLKEALIIIANNLLT